MSCKTPSCVQCNRPLSSASSPFCSPRCKEVDLYRWLEEEFRIEAEAEDIPLSEEISDESVSFVAGLPVLS